MHDTSPEAFEKLRQRLEESRRSRLLAWQVLQEIRVVIEILGDWPVLRHAKKAFLIEGRRAKAAGIETRIGNHTFRATGITAYLKNSGKLEVVQQIANHESPRTTKLYDRRQDEISLDEIERITI
jgi:integrase